MSGKMSLAENNIPSVPFAKAIFYDEEIEIYQKANHRYIPLSRLGELIYPTNPKNIYTLIKRRSDEIEKYTMVDKLSTQALNGLEVEKDVKFINFNGIIRVLMLARTPEAKLFRDFATDKLSELMLTGSTSIRDFDKFKRNIHHLFERHDETLKELERDKNFFAAELKDMRSTVRDFAIIVKEHQKRFKNQDSQIITTVEADRLQQEVHNLAEYRSQITGESKDAWQTWINVKNKLMGKNVIPNVYVKYRHFTKEQYALALEAVESIFEEYRISSGTIYQKGGN